MRPPPQFQRLPGESMRAFRAFQIYRDQGESRSIASVARTLNLSKNTLQKWSTLYQWSERVEQWHDYLASAKIETKAKDIESMQERHAAVACMFQTKVVERITSMTDADLKQLSPADLMNWFSSSVRIEAMSRGVPAVTASINNTHASPDGGPVKVEFVEQIIRTKEEFQAAKLLNEDTLLTGDAG